MGIKEYFEKQSKDRGLSLQDLDLEIGNREKGDFDLDEVITEEDKERLVDYVKGLFVKSEWAVFFTEGSLLKILFPEEMDAFVLDEEKMKDALRTIRGNWDAEADFKVIFPKFSDSERLELREKALIELKSSYHGSPGGLSGKTIVEDQLEAAAIVKVLCPEKFANLEMDSDMAKSWNIEVRTRRLLDNLRKKGDWLRFAECAKDTRLIGERFKDLKFSDKDFEAMFRYIGEARRLGDYYFLKYLACLKILLADKVIIEENKFEVIMPQKKESLKAARKPRPVRKKF